MHSAIDMEDEKPKRRLRPVNIDVEELNLEEGDQWKEYADKLRKHADTTANTIEEPLKITPMKNRNIINKAAMILVLCVGFVHFLLLKNKDHKGNFDDDDNIFMFGDCWFHPARAVNYFYCIYFLYLLLLILGVLKPEGIFKKKIAP